MSAAPFPKDRPRRIRPRSSFSREGRYRAPVPSAALGPVGRRADGLRGEVRRRGQRPEDDLGLRQRRLQECSGSTERSLGRATSGRSVIQQSITQGPFLERMSRNCPACLEPANLDPPEGGIADHNFGLSCLSLSVARRVARLEFRCPGSHEGWPPRLVQVVRRRISAGLRPPPRSPSPPPSVPCGARLAHPATFHT